MILNPPVMPISIQRIRLERSARRVLPKQQLPLLANMTPKTKPYTGTAKTWDCRASICKQEAPVCARLTVGIHTNSTLLQSFAQTSTAPKPSASTQLNRTFSRPTKFRPRREYNVLPEGLYGLTKAERSYYCAVLKDSAG